MGNSKSFPYDVPTDVQVFGRDIKKEQLKYHNKRALVAREFTFDSAHHLHDYVGKCQSLHGHTYKLEVGISSYLSDNGISVDFGTIKEIYQERVHQVLDHRYLNEALPPMNTTAENIAHWIFEQFEEALEEYRLSDSLEARVEFIRLYETPTSYAEIIGAWYYDPRKGR